MHFNHQHGQRDSNSRSKVLETAILPLNYARNRGLSRFSKWITCIKNKVPGHRPRLCKGMFKLLPGEGIMVLFQNLCNLSCAYGTAAFANGKFQTFFHRDRLDQLHCQGCIIARHNHFSSCR